MGRFLALFTKSQPSRAPAAESSRTARFDDLGANDDAEVVEYASRRDYDALPILTVREWDYGNGLDEGTDGLGFRTPDGKAWAGHNCLWSTWHELGVLVIPAVGAGYHVDELNDPSFDPGCPLRLISEPDNPHDPKAISIRNWTADRKAGYVKKGNTTRLRNLVRGQDLRVMALSCRHSEVPPHGRLSLKIVIFRPDRLAGADDIPPHGPIA